MKLKIYFKSDVLDYLGVKNIIRERYGHGYDL